MEALEETPEIGAFYRKPLKSINEIVKFGSQNVGVKILDTKLMFDAAGIDTSKDSITNVILSLFQHTSCQKHICQQTKTQFI